MAKGKRAWLNFNIPKVGRISTGKHKVATLALTAAVGAVVWNYSPLIPVVGPYIAKGESMILRGLGFGGGAASIVSMTGLGRYSTNVA